MFDHQMFTTQRKPPGSCDPEYAIMQSTQSWTYYYTNSNPWSNVNKKQIQIQTQIHYEYMQSCKAPNLEYLNAFCYKFRYIVVQSPRNTKTYKYGFIHTFCAFIYVWSECFHFDLVFFWRKLSQVAIVHCHVHQTRKWEFRKKNCEWYFVQWMTSWQFVCNCLTSCMKTHWNIGVPLLMSIENYPSR